MTERQQTIALTLDLPPTVANLRLDQALAKAIPEYSRTQLKAWLEEGHLLVNGQTRLAKSKVTGGEHIDLNVTLAEQGDWVPQAIPLDIVYDDESVCVVNKPAGMVVHPAPGNFKHTLVNALLHHYPQLSAMPRAGILHRLDKDTSGLLLVAKTPQARTYLARQLKNRKLLRKYSAIVEGKFISGGKVEAAIGRHPLHRKQMAVTDTGKPAITHYRIGQSFRCHTLLQVQLETGRTHQIRVHMAYIKHPVVGDPVYNKRIKIQKTMSAELIQALRQFPRQALHAHTLGFTHPTTKEFLSFSQAIPSDMQQLVDLLEADST